MSVVPEPGEDLSVVESANQAKQVAERFDVFNIYSSIETNFEKLKQNQLILQKQLVSRVIKK